MILISQRVTKIVQAKPRTYLLIENLTDSTLYISNREYTDIEDYTRNSIVIKLDGTFELSPCMYQGSFYAVCDIESDVRVLEL